MVTRVGEEFSNKLRPHVSVKDAIRDNPQHVIVTSA